MWLNIAQFDLMEAHRSSEECAGADRASPRRPPAGRSRSGVDDDYCADLYALLPQVCQRPTLDAVRHRQRPQEDCKIVREREELLPHGMVANEQHDSRDHFVTFLPFLIHYSAVPCPS